MSWAGKLSPLAVLRHTVRVVGSVPRSGPPRREAVSLEVAAEACGVPPEQMFVWELGYQALTLAEVEMLAGLYRQPLHLVARAAAETYRGAAMRDGVSRERALAPLDYAERVFDRLGVDRPASLLNPRGPRPVSLEAARPVLASPAPARMALDLVEQLAAALAGSCDWSAQLSQILADVADGHLSPEESRRVDLIRSQADRAAASILHVQHLLAEVGAVLGPGRGRDGSGVRTPGRAG